MLEYISEGNAKNTMRVMHIYIALNLSPQMSHGAVFRVFDFVFSGIPAYFFLALAKQKDTVKIVGRAVLLTEICNFS